MITSNQINITSFALSEEGLDIASRGSHEYRVWEVLPVKGAGEPVGVPDLKVGPLLVHPSFTLSHIQVQELTNKKLVGDETAKIGQMRAFKNKWIAKEGAGFVRAVSSALCSSIWQNRTSHLLPRPS